MDLWQIAIVAIYGLMGLVGCVIGVRKSKNNSSYGDIWPFYYIYTAFVWGDIVIFGAFWFVVALLCLLLQDFTLFLLTLSLFWVVRSIGEAQYWFHQQFTPRKGNPPEKFWYYKIYKNDAVWFVNQIQWQCIAVLALIATLYTGYMWLSQL